MCSGDMYLHTVLGGRSRVASDPVDESGEQVGRGAGTYQGKALSTGVMRVRVRKKCVLLLRE